MCKLQYAPVLFIKFLSVELIYEDIHKGPPILSPNGNRTCPYGFRDENNALNVTPNPLTSTNGSKIVTWLPTMVCVHNG